MRVEIHTRPMILPKLAGKPDRENALEVDVWIDRGDGCWEVILELVAPNEEAGFNLANELLTAFWNAKPVTE